jgi:hypothetical protein
MDWSWFVQVACDICVYICVMYTADVCIRPVLPACLAAARYMYKAASMAYTVLAQVLIQFT